MKYTKQEKKQLKELLYEIYPTFDEFFPNTMTPAIFKAKIDNGLRVSFLAYGDKKQLKNFQDQDLDIEVSMHCKPNQDKVGEDLIVRLDLIHKLGHPVFGSVVYGNAPLHQKAFIQALKEVDYLYFWIVTHPDKELLIILKVPFDWEEHKEVLDKLAGGVEVQLS